MSLQSIITTYSIATPIRLSIWENGFEVYQHILPNKRKATLCTNFKLKNSAFVFIDMDKKKLNNINAKALYD